MFRNYVTFNYIKQTFLSILHRIVSEEKMILMHQPHAFSSNRIEKYEIGMIH